MLKSLRPVCLWSVMFESHAIYVEKFINCLQLVMQ